MISSPAAAKRLAAVATKSPLKATRLHDGSSPLLPTAGAQSHDDLVVTPPGSTSMAHGGIQSHLHRNSLASLHESLASSVSRVNLAGTDGNKEATSEAGENESEDLPLKSEEPAAPAEADHAGTGRLMVNGVGVNIVSDNLTVNQDDKEDEEQHLSWQRESDDLMMDAGAPNGIPGNLEVGIPLKEQPPLSPVTEAGAGNESAWKEKMEKRVGNLERVYQDQKKPVMVQKPKETRRKWSNNDSKFLTGKVAEAQVTHREQPDTFRDAIWMDIAKDVGGGYTWQQCRLHYLNSTKTNTNLITHHDLKPEERNYLAIAFTTDGPQKQPYVEIEKKFRVKYGHLYRDKTLKNKAISNFIAALKKMMQNAIAHGKDAAQIRELLNSEHRMTIGISKVQGLARKFGLELPAN